MNIYLYTEVPQKLKRTMWDFVHLQGALLSTSYNQTSEVLLPSPWLRPLPAFEFKSRNTQRVRKMWRDDASIRSCAGHANLSLLNYASIMFVWFLFPPSHLQMWWVPLGIMRGVVQLFPWAEKRRKIHMYEKCTKMHSPAIRLCKQRIETPGCEQREMACHITPYHR